jgi:hypothetical protein
LTTADDALKNLTRRELEDLRARIERELVSCVICNREGAKAYRVRASGRGSTTEASLDLCTPCFEKHRRPASNAEA